VNGDAESATSGHSRGKDNPNRLSFFRSNNNNPAEHKIESPSTNSKHHEWVVESALPAVTSTGTGGVGRQSSDVSRSRDGRSESNQSETNATREQQPGGARVVGNVRKRLSMLKLGKKSSKGSGLMGSLDEE
jgi:hypothetical protein